MNWGHAEAEWQAQLCQSRKPAWALVICNVHALATQAKCSLGGTGNEALWAEAGQNRAECSLWTLKFATVGMPTISQWQKSTKCFYVMTLERLLKLFLIRKLAEWGMINSLWAQRRASWEKNVALISSSCIYSSFFVVVIEGHVEMGVDPSLMSSSAWLSVDIRKLRGKRSAVPAVDGRDLFTCISLTQHLGLISFLSISSQCRCINQGPFLPNLH